MLEYHQICELSEEDKNKYFSESFVRIRKRNEENFAYLQVVKISGRNWVFYHGDKFVTIAEKDMEINLDFPEAGYYDYSPLDTVQISYFPNRQFKKGITKKWVTVFPFLDYATKNCSRNSTILEQLPRSPKDYEIFRGLKDDKDSISLKDKIGLIEQGKRFAHSLTRDFAVSPHFLGDSKSLSLWYRGRQCGDIFPKENLIVPKKNTLFYQEIMDTFIPSNMHVAKVQYD